REPSTQAVLASFIAKNPFGLGRIKRNSQSFSIVEEKDANQTDKLIHEVNSGFYLVRTDFLVAGLKKINTENAAGEFYLTDLFKNNPNAIAYNFGDGASFVGVNTLEDLATVSEILNLRKIKT